jgi:GH15 family glucan-1,4-alpha-glucosidase
MTDLHQASIDIIRAGQSANGAYAACASFSQYGYSWLRDGTWIAYGMELAGQHDSAEAFHRWTVKTLSTYEAHVDALIAKIAAQQVIEEADYLPTRFELNGELGLENWPDFQLDGYGAWLWGLCQHCGNADNPLWQEARPAVMLVVRYLAALWQTPNYDCWEEFRHEVHTATLAAIYGGLEAVRQLDPSLVPDDLPQTIKNFVLDQCVAADGHFMKFIGNEEVDASLLWVAVPYGLVSVDDPRYVATVAKIERDLLRPGGGIYRYAADTYYGGGEWVLLTAWLAWVYVEMGRIDDAQTLYDWIQAQARDNGELPEQVSDYVLTASYYPQWTEKWGEAACPLLWSHGMYLILESLMEGVSQ